MKSRWQLKIKERQERDVALTTAGHARGKKEEGARGRRERGGQGDRERRKKKKQDEKEDAKERRDG